jgi:hypothetical protein
MTDPEVDLLRAIALASPEEVSPAERLKALQMLRERPAARELRERGPEIDDVELDSYLDALFVVDVVLAVASGEHVNGLDPERFPVTAGVVEQLLLQRNDRA